MTQGKLFKIGGAVLGVVLALFAAEGAIRVWWWLVARRVIGEMARSGESIAIDSGPGQLREGIRSSAFPDIVYELRPNLHGTYDGKKYASDRFGFREDRTIQIEKPAGVRRILGIGDSWMWGSGVDNGETYLDRLDTSLRAEGLRVETINTGVWGYNVVQQVATLARKGRQFSPDIVVIGLCGNDREYPNFLDADSYLSVSGSALFRVLAKALHRAGVGGPGPAAAPGTLMPFAELMNAYEELSSLARSDGFQVVVFSECVAEPLSLGRCSLGTGEEWESFLSAVRDRWHFHLCGWDIGAIDQNLEPWGHASVKGNEQLAVRLNDCLRPLLGAAGAPGQGH